MAAMHRRGLLANLGLGRRLSVSHLWLSGAVVLAVAAWVFDVVVADLGSPVLYLCACVLLVAVPLNPVGVGTLLTALSAVGLTLADISGTWQSTAGSIAWFAVMALGSARVGRHVPWAAAPLVVAAAAVGVLTSQEAGSGMYIAVVTGGLVGAVAHVRAQSHQAEALWSRATTESRRVTAENQALRSRLRLAQDLHDSVGHHVSAISLLGEAALARPPSSRDATLSKLLTQVADQAREAMTSLDSLVADLRGEPTSGVQFNDIRGVEALAEPLRAAGVEVVINVDAPDRIPIDVSDAAFRVVQEGITNTQRHAEPTLVTVRVSTSEGRLDIRVTDNGVGLDPTSEAGFGLKGISERVTVLGGTWTISTTDHGTELAATIPLTTGTKVGGEPAS